MDIHSRQLVRLGELLGMSAEALRDLITIHDEASERRALDEVADELTRLASIVTEVARSRWQN